jgi:glycosyltransferase involved in cell wall biosynthesis
MVLRALHVIPALADRYGGPSQAVLGMVQWLRRYNIESEIATTDADGPSRLPVDLGQRVEYRGVPATFFPRQWSESWKYSRPLGRWLGAHAHEFDVVHIHAVFSHASVAAARAAARRGVPYVVRPLGTLDPWSLRQKALKKRVFWQVLGRQMLAGASAVHYTTVAERRLVEDSMRLKRGVVIPIGIAESADLAALPAGTGDSTPAWVDGSPYVLSLGRLHPKKCTEMLIEAFAALAQLPELSAWKLVVAGDGEPPYRAQLETLASRAAPGRVVFTGWLTGSAKAATLQRAALLALPSRQENFGVAVVEAMAESVPVLVSEEVNLADEIAESQSGWVVRLDPESLRAGLRTAMGETESRRRRGAAGRRLVAERFTWPQVTRMLADLYASLAR